MSAAVVPYSPPGQPAAEWRGVRPHDMDSALRFAKAIAASGLLPSSFYGDGKDPVAGAFVCIQMGAEIGLPPLMACQNIAIVNGRPGLFGPAALAVVERSGKLADIDEHIEGDGDARTAVCVVQRVGRKPRRFTFSVDDAKRAGLWDKRGRSGAAGPWQQYPERMLAARARGFALRDVFPDVLLGLSYSVEELRDFPLDDGVPYAEPPAAPAPAKPVDPPADEPKRPTFQLEGFDATDYPKTVRGFILALEALESEAGYDWGPRLVAQNARFLDEAAKWIPDGAARVASVRSVAAEVMAAAAADDPPAEDSEQQDEPPDDFPGGPAAAPAVEPDDKQEGE